MVDIWYILKQQVAGVKLKYHGTLTTRLGYSRYLPHLLCRNIRFMFTIYLNFPCEVVA